MASSAISLRIALSGAAEVRSQLDALAAAGARSMKLLADAGGAGAAGLASIGAAVARIKEASAAIGSVGVGTATAAGIESIGQAMKRTGEEFAGAELSGRTVLSLFDEFERGQRGAMFSTIGEAVKRAGESLEGLAIGATAAVAAFYEFGKSAAEATREVEDQARLLGTTVEKLDGIRYAAAQAGVSQDALTEAISRFASNAGRAEVQGQRLAEEQRLHAGDAGELALKQDELATSIREAGLAAERSARQFSEASDPITGLVANADRGVEAAQRALTRAKEAAFAQYGSTSISPTEESIYSTAADRAKNDAAQRIADAEHAVDEATRRAAQARQHIADMAREQELARQKAAEAQRQREQEAHQKTIEAEQHAHPILRPGQGVLQEALGADLAKGDAGLPDMIELLASVADRLNAITNPAQRAAAAQQLFGESFYKIDPLLQLGSARLRQYEQDWKNFKLDPTAAESQAAGVFNVAFGNLSRIIEGLRVSIGDIFAGAFAPFVQGLATALANSSGEIRAFATEIVALMAPIGLAIRQTAGTIATALALVNAALNAVGVHLSPGSIIALGLVAFASMWSRTLTIIALLTTAVAALQQAFTKTFGADSPINAGIIIVIALLVRLIGPLREVFSLLKTAAIFAYANAWSVLTNKWVIAAAALTTIAVALALILVPMDQLKAKLAAIGDAVGGVLAKIPGFKPAAGAGDAGDAGTTGAAAASEPGAAYDNPIGGPSTAAGSGAASSSSSAAPSGGEADQGAGFAPAPSAADFAGADIIAGYQGHATGGEVHGPSGRDVIPARLTRGEFVNTVHAVRTLGTRFFAALNAAPERFAGLRDALGAARGFSLGGLVDNLSVGLSPAPLRLALGGPVDGRPASGGSRFTLVLDGQPHEVHGEDHVIGSIERYARRRQLLSAGRRATAVGGG